MLGKNKLIKYVGFIIFNIVLIIFAFEIVLRTDYFEQGFLHQKTWNPMVTLNPNPLLEHTYMPSQKFMASEIYSSVFQAYGTDLLGEDYTIEINKMGLRDEEILPKKEDEIVVLFIGDSLVAGTQVNRDLIMTSVSENILNNIAKEKKLNVSFRTINAGVGGYNLINSLENYKRISKKVKPDIVVLGIFVNDIMPYSKYFSSDMKIRHFFLKHFHTLRLLKLLKNYTKLYLSKDHESTQDPEETQTDRKAPYEKVLDRLKLSSLYPKYFPETASFIGKTSFSDSYPQRSLGWLKDSITEDSILKELSLVPRPLSYYKSTAYIVKLIHDEITKQNIPLIICLFPVPTAYDDNEFDFALEYFNIKEESIERHRPQRLLSLAIREQINEPDLKLIDLTIALSAASKDKRTAIPMDCHFGAPGHQAVGKVVAEEIWKLTAPSE